MIEEMIEKWNKKVSKEDNVYILGDFSWGSSKATKDILNRLNGKFYLIKGNHDYYLKDKTVAEYFEWVKDYAEINDNGKRVILSHYPILFYNGQWRKSWMLHGHIHNTNDQQKLTEVIDKLKQTYDDGEPFQMINCFCAYSGYVPLTLEDWIAETEKTHNY